MTFKIKHKRGPASALTSANLTLSAGELAFETDTRRFKLGDGTTAWSSLSYVTPYVTATDRILGRSSAGAGSAEEITCGSFGRSLIGSADAAAARTTLSVQPTASPAFTGAATFTVSSGSSVPVTVANSGTGNSLVVANNFIVDGSGRLGLFGAPRAFEACAVLGTAPSSSQASLGFRVQCTYPSSTTTDAASFSSFPATQAASYTLTNLYHFAAFQNAFGAGSTVTNQYGLFVDSTLTGATNNYAVYTGIASGTGRWAIYAAGTAASYFGGQVQISAGSGTGPSSYVPGLAVSGDPDTGLQQVGGANTISLVTAGSERVRVDASGNVGIGGASGGNNLHVFGTSDSIAAFGGSTKHVRIGYDSTADRGIIECADFGTIAKNLIIRGRDIIFENAIFGVGEGMRLTDANELRIGYPTTDNGAYKLQVNSQIYATNATIATSDARFKTNVESLTDATAVIEALRPVAFDFIPHAERKFATERQVGLIAQEAQSALAGTDYADSVVAQCGDHLGLAYEKLVPVLIKALQESNARIAALEERLNHA